MKRMSLALVVPAVCGLSLLVNTVGCTDGGSSSSSSGTPGRSSSSSSTGGGGSSAGGGSSGIVASSNMGGSSGIVASSNMGGSSGIVASSGGGSGGNPTALGNQCTQATGATDCAGLNMPGCFIEMGETNGFCAATGCTVGQACAGAGTMCVTLGTSAACIKTCNPAGADGQCGAGKACVGIDAQNGGCIATTLAECNYTTMQPACPSPMTCGRAGLDGFGTCLSGCDPFGNPACTMANQTCQPDQAGMFGCIPKTAAAGTAGSSCMYTNDCNSGLICAGTPATCKQLCSATQMCATGTCGMFSNLPGYGACM